MKHASRLLLLIQAALWSGAISEVCLGEIVAEPTTTVHRVEQMPNLPLPFAMRDWRQVTLDYLGLALDFQQHGEHMPLVRWLDAGHTMVSFPSYVGGPNDPEAIHYLAAVVSGSLFGLDILNYHALDFVTLCPPS